MKSTTCKTKFSVDNVLITSSTPLSSKSVNFSHNKSNFIRSKNCIFLNFIYNLSNFNKKNNSNIKFW